MTMEPCRFCAKPSDTGVCGECQKQVEAARGARIALEEKLALLEDKVQFIMDFIQPGFQGPVIGPNKQLVMSLNNFFELCYRRKLETGLSLDDAKAAVVQQLTGLINNA